MTSFHTLSPVTIQVLGLWETLCTCLVIIKTPLDLMLLTPTPTPITITTTLLRLFDTLASKTIWVTLGSGLGLCEPDHGRGRPGYNRSLGSYFLILSSVEGLDIYLIKSSSIINNQPNSPEQYVLDRMGRFLALHYFFASNLYPVYIVYLFHCRNCTYI